MEAAGLPPIRLHDLRHVAATLMLAAGVDIKVVSETLGHSDTRVTRDIYQAVLDDLARDAAEKVVQLVPRARKPLAVVKDTEAAPARPKMPPPEGQGVHRGTLCLSERESGAPVSGNLTGAPALRRAHLWSPQHRSRRGPSSPAWVLRRSRGVRASARPAVTDQSSREKSRPTMTSSTLASVRPAK